MALVDGVSEPALVELRTHEATANAPLANSNGVPGAGPAVRLSTMKAALLVRDPSPCPSYVKDGRLEPETAEEEGAQGGKGKGEGETESNGTGEEGAVKATKCSAAENGLTCTSDCSGDESSGTSKMADSGDKREGSGAMVNGVSGAEGDNASEDHFPTSGSTEYEHLIESVIQCLEWKVDKQSLTEEALELLRLVPEGYIPLPHQVGGHRHVDGKLGFLRKEGHPEVLYKPVQPGVKGPREVMFYETMFGDDIIVEELPEDIQQLRSIIPRYLGTANIRDRDGHIHEFMMLEDITDKFRRPCILDVKIGRRVWDDFAETDKIEREKKKYPAQEVIGWRIIGMRIYTPETDEYTYYDKFFGRSVTENSALEAISHFFTDGSSNSHRHLIEPILDKLRVFAHWFTFQTTLKLFATSLLIVYEGDTTQPIPPEELLDIRLVDFAHTYERDPDESGLDENALFGLTNFILFLQKLQEDLPLHH